MIDIIKLNEISPLVKDVFLDKYQLVSESQNPQGIMVRSFVMHEYTPNDSVLCVGRAGAGVNNIPVEDYAKKGIVVFNTPGANANAVKELVISALLLSARKIAKGIAWSNTLVDGEKTVAEQVEKGKKAFGGTEILGKTLGVWGLGAIGKKVAKCADALGMKVIGFDPYLNAEGEKEIAEFVTIVKDKEELLKNSDYITLHVPLTAETKNSINKDSIAIMKTGVKIINCSRGEIVNNEDIIEATMSGKVSTYTTDFPNAQIVNKDNIICIPHLGASTEEAEDNCAVMAAKQMVDYIENGNIKNSVNFPAVSAVKGKNRLVVLFEGEDAKQSIESLVGGVKATIAMKKNFGVALIDSDNKLDSKAFENVKGVIKVRVI